MINKKAVICLLARDSAISLERNIPKIEKLRTHFSDSYVIIIENDSKDNTKELLEEWKNNSTGIFIQSEDTGTTTIPKTAGQYFPGMSKRRMEKMIAYRNKYLEFVERNDLNPDYLIVLDSDIYDFKEETIEKTLNVAPDDWVGLFANGRYFFHPLFRMKGKYYDAYAYIPYGAEFKDLTYKEIYIENDKLCKQLQKFKFVKCDSAFAGIGIYKYEAIKGAKYYLINNNRSSVVEVLCDHVALNLQAQKNGMLYVASDLEVLYDRIKGIGAYISNILGNKILIKIWEFLKKQSFYE